MGKVWAETSRPSQRIPSSVVHHFLKIVNRLLETCTLLDKACLQRLRTCSEEVVAEWIRLKTDHVGSEDAVEDFRSSRESLEEAAFWEWCVEKPTNADFEVQGCGPLPKHEWEQHEMVVVHPDLIAVLEVARHGVCESLVRFAIGSHVAVVERHLVGLVVEQWPDCRI